MHSSNPPRPPPCSLAPGTVQHKHCLSILVYRQAVRAAQTVTLVYMQAGATCGTKIVTLVYRQAVRAAQTVTLVYMQAGATCGTKIVTLVYRQERYVQHKLPRWSYMQAGATCGTKIVTLVYRQAVRATQTATLVYRQAVRAKQTPPVTLIYRRAVVQPKYQLSR